MPEDRPHSPLTTLLEPVLPLPPSALTADDWARIYGEEFADWMRLTPSQRWRESCRLWDTFYALGGRLDNDPTPGAGPDGVGHDAAAWRPRPADGRAGVYRLRRLGV
ncbi:hypothetical protein rosag_48230 [Roseisolibacter agri]|uniref:Uncharacterized protein n=1 Tax=Roseisolibacter agri TaxID=2014610 RepID=A0AA37Q831_9BACT|nr:hypothetical protein rosag_48230 [Roseisolibacter agri]